MALAGTRSVSAKREATGRLSVHPPPKGGAEGWGSTSRAHAIAACDIANQILILAQQGATGAIAGLLPQLDAALAALPAGDGQAWGENLVRLLESEGALNLELAAPAAPITSSAGSAWVSDGASEPVLVPVEMIPLEAVEVAPGQYAIPPEPAGIPWPWIAGGAVALALSAWLVLRRKR